MNVTLQILNAFLYHDFISHKNFPGHRTNSCTVRASNFFKTGIFKNVKKTEKIHMDLKNQEIHLKWKKDRLPDYLLDRYFVYQFVNNF